MIYRTFQNLKLSQLGMGTMRLPVIGNDMTKIDDAAVEKMVADAFKAGVNYFDTAWGYHDGQSEISMGKALAKYPRESFYLADKFPGYDLSNIPHVREIFEKQLEKTGAGYFDFYLIHNVHELNINQYLDPQYGIFDYLMEQKKNGRIKHLGFSTHANYDTFMRFMKAYGDSMEFCQIQLNYLDYDFQEAKLKIEELNKRNIPVIVMEPLRGGRLSNLTEAEAAAMKKIRPEATPTEMAFRWLQTMPGVTVILSGMSNPEQMEQNLKTFETDKPFSEAEMAAVKKLADSMINPNIQPCTSCRYCTSHCPQELNIPFLISLYNENRVTGVDWRAPMALGAIPKEKWPQSCIACRSCEQVCPQSIKISEVLAALVQDLS